MLIDGNSLAYRAFFALPADMATSSGQVTNAVFGFTSMLAILLKNHPCESIVVAFDRPEPTFRHKIDTEYKANREATPDILSQQMGLIRQLVQTLGIQSIELAGYEADDLIATLATQAAEQGDEALIVTGDRDAFQLVQDPFIKVLYNRKGVSDYVLYDEQAIKERTGVLPSQYPFLSALKGDVSDHIPGVPGVGEKTAAKLVNQFQDLESLFENLDSLTPKLKNNLSEAEQRVRKNILLTPVDRKVPLNLEIKKFNLANWDKEQVHQLFGFLEFSSALLQRFIELSGSKDQSYNSDLGLSQTIELDIVKPTSVSQALEMMEKLFGIDEVVIEAGWSAIPGRSNIEGLLFAHDAKAIWLSNSFLAEPQIVEKLNSFFSQDNCFINAHGAKEIMRVLGPLGIDISNLGIDTAIAAYLVDPSAGKYDLGQLAQRYVHLEMIPNQDPQDSSGQLFLDPDSQDFSILASRRAFAIGQLSMFFRQSLKEQGLYDLYDQIERPLVRVLSRMEQVGIKVDTENLKALIKRLDQEGRELEEQIQDLAGERFKVNSTLQLRSILYDKLGLVPYKKTKTGYSTDASSLEKLLGKHPIIEKLLRYREVEKLRSTYGEGLLAEVGKDGRIHASFNQTVARTGRLSSDKPNLHNIPIRTKEGRLFRAAFIPDTNKRFLVADYNQIELRVIAHLCDDPGLVEAFRQGIDIHTVTAARVFGIPESQVSFEQRSKAKMVSYGLAYGMEAYGLSQRLGVGVEEASNILNSYFSAFPNVKNYMDKTVEEAKSKGYTETLFGRRRNIPELSSSNYRIRQAGERQAMNAGIQGLAADIFKVALVKLDKELESRRLKSRLILQIHDEVIVEAPSEEEEVVREVTLDAMQKAATLKVPLEVNLSWCNTWAEAKS